MTLVDNKMLQYSYSQLIVDTRRYTVDAIKVYAKKVDVTTVDFKITDAKTIDASKKVDVKEIYATTLGAILVDAAKLEQQMVKQ